MNAVFRSVARELEGVVACWQLRERDLSWKVIAGCTRGLRALHDGVYLTGEGPLTQRQRWWAAVHDDRRATSASGGRTEPAAARIADAATRPLRAARAPPLSIRRRGVRPRTHPRVADPAPRDQRESRRRGGRPLVARPPAHRR